MAHGTIITRTCTSDAELPVENVVVGYFAPGEDGGELLAVRRTDRSGRTAPAFFDTPELSESQHPEEPDDPAPYRVVDIVADHPDFDRVTVKDVQVFEGIVTYQDIELVPLGAEGSEEVFDTSRQEL